MKKILLLITVITLVFSCKNEEKPIQNEQPIVVEEAPKQLELFITCKTDKTDKIEVIFNRIEQTAKSNSKSLFTAENTTISSDGFNIIDKGGKIVFHGNSLVTLKWIFFLRY